MKVVDSGYKVLEWKHYSVLCRKHGDVKEQFFTDKTTDLTLEPSQSIIIINIL